VPKKVAVILAGAVAKGAFEAGALKVLARQDLEVTRIVATSSGALNGAMYASYVRRGIERTGTFDLLRLWTHRASGWSMFRPDLASILRLEGLLSAERVRDLLRSRIAAGAIPAPRPISLRILVAPLRGIESRYLDARARDEDPDRLPLPRNRTTYEYVCDFTQDDFDTEAARDRVVEAALASSAFPFAFTPVELEDPRLDERLGPCIDGGAVNNTPIKWALEGALGDQLDAIIVIAPVPELEQRPGEVRGGKLIDQTAAALVNERLYRDLREAERINAQLARLATSGLPPEQLATVKQALGWTSMKQIGIVQIRPLVPLEGGAFSAFFRKAQRRRYIEIGEECALTAFADPQNRQILFSDPPEKLRLVP
jgi:NTE family protein